MNKKSGCLAILLLIICLGMLSPSFASARSLRVITEDITVPDGKDIRMKEKDIGMVTKFVPCTLKKGHIFERIAETDPTTIGIYRTNTKEDDECENNALVRIKTRDEYARKTKPK